MRDVPDTSKAAYDLVVIGAGIAGLNALNAASDYLPKGAKALLIDQKDAPGGMWNTAYDYVRLHQPHPMFTVGNFKWNWRKPRSYLAARDEVQSHLGRALDKMSGALDIQTRFGQTVTTCHEVDTPVGPMAEITFHPNDAPATAVTVRATKAIHAAGLDYAMAPPLIFETDRVVSIIPQDLTVTLAAHPDAPVVVVGGGKTGMDTVLAALRDSPAREISVIHGRGTNFLNRTKYLPTGLKRWTSGQLVSAMFRELAMTFDGDNEAAVLSHVRQVYSTTPEAHHGVYLFGLQSEDEAARIKAGVSQVHSDYLETVTQTPSGPQMVLRGGESVPVAPGSIFVNCTGSFFRTPDMARPRDVLSPHGCILSINARNAFHFLTSVAGFFLPHLWYRGALTDHGFYTLDMEDLFRKDRNVWVGAASAHAYLNQVTALQTLPLTLLDRCGLDLDRWYPLPRRIAGLIKMKAHAKSDIAHCQAVLDRVATRCDVTIRPI